jgi:hypothetical protein
MKPQSLNTLGDLAESFRLYGVCNVCHASRDLDLASLIRELGEAFPIQSVKPRLRCRECRSKGCGIQIVWGGNRSLPGHGATWGEP